MGKKKVKKEKSSGTPTSTKAPKKSLLERLALWRSGTRLRISLTSKFLPLSEEWRTVPSGLVRGTKKEKVDFERIQFLEAGEYFIDTVKLKERAVKVVGHRGEECSQSMFDQRKKLPLSWRSLRIYFLADLHYFEPATSDPEKGTCCVRKIEYDEKRRDWVRSLVEFEKNIWTRKDFFIIQV